MDARTLCLGVLARGDASGYEIKKSFEEGPFAHIQAASFGSIYPALTRLSEDGLLACRAEPQDKRPDKKVYSITPAGRDALAARLMKAPADDRLSSDFLFILFFAHILPPPLLAEFIDQRIAWYEASAWRAAAWRRGRPASASSTASAWPGTRRRSATCGSTATRCWRR